VNQDEGRKDQDEPRPTGFWARLGDKLDEIIERLKTARKWRYITAACAFLAAALGVVSALRDLILFPDPKIAYASLYDNSVYGTRHKDGYYMDLLLYNDGASDVETVHYSLFTETPDGEVSLLYDSPEPIWMEGHGQERPKHQFPAMTEPPTALIGCVWHADALTGYPYVISRARAEDQGTGEYVYKLDRRPTEGTTRGDPPDCAALAAELR
jgi:hypothetical protein